MSSNNFLERVREEFGTLARANGLRETKIIDLPVYKEITFADDRRFVKFYLDVRDGYLDARYGRVAAMRPDGRAPKVSPEEFAAQRSVSDLLRPLGFYAPDRSEGLFEGNALHEVLSELVSGIARCSNEVFSGS